MALQIPTISELYTQILADVEGELGSSVSIFGKAYIRASVAVQSAKMKLYYLTLAGVQKNIFIDTADPEAIGGTLERFGRVKLGRDPFPATNSKYTVEVTGNIAAIVKAGTQFKSDDNSANPGKLFVLDVEKTIVTVPDTMQLRSLETGLDTRLIVTNTLTSTSPIANVDKLVTVTVEDEIPLGAEDLEVYRQKGIDAYQLEPQGGAPADYRIWSADAQGVLRVFPFAKSGAPWDINLYIEATEADSTDGKGTPTAAILQEVEDVVELDPDTTKDINDRGRRPMDVIVDFLAITPLDIDVFILGGVGITSELETAITDAIRDYLRTVRPFVAGADVVINKNDVLTSGKLSTVAYGAIPDSVYFETLNFSVDDNPVVTSFTFLNGDIPFLNSVTF